MTDYPSAITPDYRDYMTPIEVDETTKANLENPPPSKLNYRTPCNSIECVISIICIIVGISGSIIMLQDSISNDKEFKNILFSFCPLVFTLAGLLIGFISDFYVFIQIDNYYGIIVIKQRKISFCFNKTRKIQINEVKEVSIESDTTMYTINGKRYGSFRIIIRLNEGRRIKVCKDVIDKDNESKKAFNILRRGLSQNIPIVGNLAY